VALVNRRRVVITGLGILSSVGIGKARFWDALKHGCSGIRPITSFDAETYPVRIAGHIEDFDPHAFHPYELTRRLSRFSLLGLAAGKLAWEDADLTRQFDSCDRERTCVVLGTSLGAFSHAEEIHSLFVAKGLRRIPPFFNHSALPSSCAAQIGKTLGIHGSVSTITTACASGTSAIGEAFRSIRDGSFDIAIAGASEAPITPLAIATFSSAGILSTENDQPTKACRPFSKDRNGTVLAEGAALVVLEELEHARRRPAKIYGEILGYGATFDSYHELHPLPSAEFGAKAMLKALADAVVTPKEIDYVNAHGSGTVLNDKIETLAIKKAFGGHAYSLVVNSTKSIVGHTMGACGALEFVACALTLENQYVHPTINLASKDPECDLDYVPNVGRPLRISTILSNSSGFGGHNAACVIRKFDA
jgi:3-oxoacyl-[acyl-carrier-protein] synthase II